MIKYLSDLLNVILNDKLLQLGLSEVVVESLVRSGLILLVLFASWIAHRIAQGPLMRSFERFSRFTNQQWDNVLVEKHFFSACALLLTTDTSLHTDLTNFGWYSAASPESNADQCFNVNNRHAGAGRIIEFSGSNL